MQVNNVMTHDVGCIGPNASLQEASAKMKELDVGSLPVCENGRPIGMITDRDITIRATAESLPPRLGQVSDVMTREVVYCFEDDDTAEAAELMKDKQIRRLLVLNRDKQLVGIVSLGDLAVDGQDAHLAEEALEAVSHPAGNHGDYW
jgi:CBS domain-containing protein